MNTGSQGLILVVDDNDASRYATTRVLRAAGFQTAEAANGGDALAAATDAVSLVVLDVNLPDMDGFQVCRELRARRETADLPVVYLSATFTNNADMAQGMRAGADSYLTHPADPVALVATVRTLLFVRESHATRRAANARFQAIFDVAPTGMAMLDSTLYLTDVNAAFAALMGSDRATLIGKPVASLFEANRAAVVERMQAAVRSGAVWQEVLRRTGPGQSHAELEWAVARGPEASVLIAMVTDVTERRLSETRQQRSLDSERAARAEAELSNQLKDEFLATLSHELRNPLGAILGWATVLKAMPGLQAPVMQGVEAIERNAKVQSHLISDLLDFAGIRFGKMRLDVQPLDAANVVLAAVETVTHLAARKGVTVTCEPQPQSGRVLGDESRLQQVIWNLLTNAIKFTPAGGHVTVVAGPKGGSYEISVCDSGKGIAAEFIPRLFERFSQQEAGKDKRFAGLGIGLAIVQDLIELHDGRIEVHSAGEGQGATFTVTLPLTMQDAPLPLPLEGGALAGIRVMVVEDGVDTRALIVRLLADAGATVADVGSADEALELIALERPDVLVSDIGMANTDGYSLIRALRIAGHTPQVLPAIALTAFVRSEDRLEALRAGFQIHLGKPVNANALIAAVARLGASPAVPERG